MEYKLSKEESERINMLKFIGIVFVVFIHSYTTGVNFADGTLVIEQPLWLDAIEYNILYHKLLLDVVYQYSF